MVSATVPPERTIGRPVSLVMRSSMRSAARASIGSLAPSKATANLGVNRQAAALEDDARRHGHQVVRRRLGSRGRRRAHAQSHHDPHRQLLPHAHESFPPYPALVPERYEPRRCRSGAGHEKRRRDRRECRPAPGFPPGNETVRFRLFDQCPDTAAETRAERRRRAPRPTPAPTGPASPSRAPGSRAGPPRAAATGPPGSRSRQDPGGPARRPPTE